MAQIFAELIVYGLATWRLSSILVNEAGPRDIFLHFRELIGIGHDDNKEIAIIPETFLAGVFSCMWCMSVWVGAFWVVFGLFFPTIAIQCAMVFALSAAAIWVERMKNA